MLFDLTLVIYKLFISYNAANYHNIQLNVAIY